MENEDPYNFPEMSPLSDAENSLSNESVQYSQMSDLDAEIAFAARRDQIKASLKTPKNRKNLERKSSCSVNSSVMRSNASTPKKMISRRPSTNSVQEKKILRVQRSYSSNPTSPRRKDPKIKTPSIPKDINTSVSSIQFRQISLSKVSSCDVSFSKEIQEEFKRKMDQKVIINRGKVVYDINEPLCERAVK